MAEVAEEVPAARAWTADAWGASASDAACRPQGTLGVAGGAASHVGPCVVEGACDEAFVVPVPREGCQVHHLPSLLLPVACTTYKPPEWEADDR